MKKHNGVISIWKFVFSLSILAHHFQYINFANGDKLHHFICGAIGVDFFFLVTGYLLASKVSSETRKGDSRSLHVATKEFIFRKIKAVFPYFLFSFIIIFCLDCYYGTLETKKDILFAFQDFTFATATGFVKTGEVGGIWYLSAMIIASMIIYPLLKKYKQFFSWIIAPLLGVFIGGYLLSNFQSIRAWDEQVGVFKLGLLKALFEMSIGCTLFEITSWIKTIKFTKAGKIMLSIISFTALCSVWFFNMWENDVRMLDWLWIVMLIIGITIAFSEQTFFYKMCCNKFFYYLEKISIALYLNNFVFIEIVNNSHLVDGFSVIQAIGFVSGGDILLSVVEIHIIDLLSKIMPKLLGSLKNIFIASA